MILLVQHFRTFTVVSFEIQVREAASGPYLHPCFYYDTGSGFSEAEKTCFEYNRHPISEFQSYRIVLPVRRPVRQLRFDPLEEPGIVALRKVAVGRTRFTADAFRFAAVNLAREFGRTVVPLHTVALTQEGDTLVARLTGDDPYFMLMANGLRRRAVLALRARLQAAAISLVFSIALVLLFRLRARIWTGPPRYRDALRRYVPTLATSARSVSLAALTAFVVTTISAKVFAILTSALRYGRPIAVTNLVAAPAESMAIGLLALAAVLIIMRADRICAGHSWMAPVRVLLAGTQFLISLTLVIFALFEILCSYVFWEWGSYVDGSLILLAYESPTPDSLHLLSHAHSSGGRGAGRRRDVDAFHFRGSDLPAATGSAANSNRLRFYSCNLVARRVEPHARARSLRSFRFLTDSPGISNRSGYKRRFGSQDRSARSSQLPFPAATPCSCCLSTLSWRRRRAGCHLCGAGVGKAGEYITIRISSRDDALP